MAVQGDKDVALVPDGISAVLVREQRPMAFGSTLSRDQRRRRVLGDDSRQMSIPISSTVQEGTRYTEAASIENYPQVTDFIPRKLRSYVAASLVGISLIGALAAMQLGSEGASQSASRSLAQATRHALQEGLSSWLTATVLAAIFMVALLNFSMRRHRVDDYKARYRCWGWLAALAGLASLDAVARLYSAAVEAGGAQGWDPQVVAWTSLGVVSTVGAFVLGKICWDMRECRLAATFGIVALGGYAFAAVAGSPNLIAERAALGPWAALALLASHSVWLLAITVNARYLVLDVQGLIEHPAVDEAAASERKATAKESARRNTQGAMDKAEAKGAKASSQAAGRKEQKLRVAAQTSSASEWVDGSEPFEDDYEEGPSSKKHKRAKGNRSRSHQRKRAA